MNNIKFYNLPSKVACLLKNIQKFSEIFHINTLPRRKLGETDNCEFPFEKLLINIVTSNHEENKMKFDATMELQTEILELNIGTSNMIVIDNYDNDDNLEHNSDSDNDITPFSERKRKRKVRNKKKTISYEIEHIVDHKIENNEYFFLIK